MTFQSAPVPITSDGMRQDLIHLRDVWASVDKSFSSAARGSFRAIISDAIANVEKLSPTQFSLEIARALALARNGHTYAELGPYFHSLPFKAVWFSDGLFIVRVPAAQKPILGSRIDRFGAISAEEILKRVTPYISGTEAHIRAISPAYLRQVEVLQHVGAGSSSEPGVELGVTLRSGERKSVTLLPESALEPDGLPAHQQLIWRRDNREVPDRWLHVLDSVEGVPSAYRSMVDVACEWLKSAEPVFYMRSNMIATVPDSAEPFFQKLGKAFEQVAENAPKFVIVDLRFNHGGYLLQTVVVAHGLPRILHSGGTVFVLVGPGTYSAAIAMVAMLKGSGRGRVVLIGETMGDSPQFWAEGLQMSLPNSRILVQPAIAYHDWANGCEGEHCFWGCSAFARPNVCLEPEIRAVTTFRDYARGKDSVLEAALHAATR